MVIRENRKQKRYSQPVQSNSSMQQRAGQISAFGIDFGTTNSAVYSLTGLRAEDMREIAYGDDQGRPFPSVVAINRKTGKVIVGRDAKNRRNELEEEFEYFSSIKSIIDQDRKYQIGGSEWTPVDIAAQIFRGLRNRVKERSNGDDDLREAVVSVPIGFTSAKRRCLRQAAEKAGIQIRQYVSEPTAAFVSNYPALKSCRNVAVFDWGGGTLDVVILKVEDGRVYEMATNGMERAGDDIDREIAERAHARISQKKNIAVPFEQVDSVTRDALLTKAEEAKIALSDGSDVEKISIIRSKTYGAVSSTEITYEFFAGLIRPDVDAAINCLLGAVEKAGLSVQNLDRILCVGGSSKLRPLREALAKRFGEEMLYYPDKVMWDIAKGDCLINLSSGVMRMNQDIGLEMDNGEFYKLLISGTRIPCQEDSVRFALTTNEKKARFIVTDSADRNARSFEQFITVPADGFMQEQFQVSCYVDPDFLFRLAIRSTKYQNQYLYLWTYDRLRVCYELEDNGNEW